MLNPRNAVIMLDNILEEIVSLDKENEDFYRKNAEEYKKEIISYIIIFMFFLKFMYIYKINS